MKSKINGIHHITAIAGDARRNHAFYTGLLGLRMVKKTVNFDDPGTYHFYYGDEQGTPGTILTFFPWERVKRGKSGAGMATDIAYSIPDKSIAFWMDRLKEHQVQITDTGTRFGEQYLSFTDPDGLPLTFIVPASAENRTPWTTEEVGHGVATRGFHSATLTLNNIRQTAGVLTDIFEYEPAGVEGSRHRYVMREADHAAIIDLIEAPALAPGINAGGTIHHIAFRVQNEDIQMAFREKILNKGLQITPKIDRNYFFSLYFREPGGVLFEIATDNPGFAVDEPVSELGKGLKLPPQYEPHREKIEKALPVLE